MAYRIEIPVATDIGVMRQRQMSKYGEQNRNDPFWLGLVQRELGSVASQMMEHDIIRNTDPNNAARARTEQRRQMIKAAAALIAWIEAFDRVEWTKQER